jgi:hypothetical protein
MALLLTSVDIVGDRREDAKRQTSADGVGRFAI